MGVSVGSLFSRDLWVEVSQLFEAKSGSATRRSGCLVLGDQTFL